MILLPTEKTSSLFNRFHSFSSSRDIESERAPTILFVHVLTSSKIADSSYRHTVTTMHTRPLPNSLWLRRFLIPTCNHNVNTENTASLNRGEITKSTHAGSPYRSTSRSRENDIHVCSQIRDCACLPSIVKEPSHCEQTSEPKH